MDSIETMFRVLVGKHLVTSGDIQPGINSWNIEIQQADQNNYCLVFHHEKKGQIAVDIKDLELLSSIFFTTNINIGPENKAHSGCASCDFGSDYQVKIHINNAGFAPPIKHHFVFSWSRHEILPDGKYYYRTAHHSIKEQCKKEYDLHLQQLALL